MQTISLSILLLSVLNVSIATNEAGNKEVSTNDLNKIAMERFERYQISIRYWDTPNEETRSTILKELAQSEEVKTPGCPRIRYPMICDNEGTILENTCYFQMKRRENRAVLPTMVFTTTGIEAARSMCDKEHKKSSTY